MMDPELAKQDKPRSDKKRNPKDSAKSKSKRDKESGSSGTTRASSRDKPKREKTRNESTGTTWVEKNEINFQQELAHGNTGTVWQGLFRSQPLALKKLHNQEPEAAQKFRDEVEVLASIRHPNVALVICACAIPGYFTVGYELVPLGSLRYVLTKGDHPSLVQKFKIANTFARALIWIHKSPIQLHKSISTAKVLVSQNYEAKLCGFGLPSFSSSSRQQYWSAPEVIDNGSYSEASDVYSSGLLLWSLFLPPGAQREPFAECSSMATFCSHLAAGRRPPTDHLHPLIVNLINRMWDQDASARPKMDKIASELPALMIEVSLPDPNARTLWVNASRASRMDTVDPGLVKISHFIEQLTATTGEGTLWTASQEYNCLQRMFGETVPSLGNAQQLYVRLERFAQMINWMGPLRPTKQTSHWVQNLKDLMAQPWFHAESSKQECDARLVETKKPGVFLVRFSSADPKTPFTLAKLEQKNVVANHRIHSYEDGYFVQIDATRRVAAKGGLPELITKLTKPLSLTKAIEYKGFVDIFVNGPVGGCYALNSPPVDEHKAGSSDDD
jgi:serine/threonine protein kinase